MNQNIHLFNTITDSIGREIIDSAKQIHIPANSPIFYQGASCENFLLVIDGSIKVYTRAVNGREIVLTALAKSNHVH